MARVKLSMRKIKNKTSRNITYSKRKSGLVKKAYEISTLCDVEIALICFSPSGKLTLFEGKKRIEDVLLNFIDSPASKRGSLPDEQLVRQLIYKLNSASGLSGNYAASSSNSGGQNEDALIEAQIEEVQKQIMLYSSKLEDVDKDLELFLKVPGDDKSPSELEEHEKFLEETLLHVRMRKSVLEEQQTIQPTGQNASEELEAQHTIQPTGQEPLYRQTSGSSGSSSYGANIMNQLPPTNLQYPGSFAPSNEFHPLSNGLGNLFGPSPFPSTYGYNFPAGTQMNQAHNSASGTVNNSQMAQMDPEPSQIPGYANNLGSIYSPMTQMNNELPQALALSSNHPMWSMGGIGNGSNTNGSNLGSGNGFY